MASEYKLVTFQITGLSYENNPAGFRIHCVIWLRSQQNEIPPNMVTQNKYHLFQIRKPCIPRYQSKARIKLALQFNEVLLN